jgi:D-sedoheptulose 7-phosphate isomerase
MQNIITAILEESIKVKNISIKNNSQRLAECANRIAETLSSGGKVLLFGNGGSAADAQHIAAEFINRFMIERNPLAAIALTTDSSIITSIGNDYSFDQIFSKQVHALGRKGDIAIGISTSGNSKNVIEAVNIAGEAGLFTIGMTGYGGAIAECVDVVLSAESDITARIQETHITMAHILCDLVDRILFPENFE